MLAMGSSRQGLLRLFSFALSCVVVGRRCRRTHRIRVFSGVLAVTAKFKTAKKGDLGRGSVDPNLRKCTNFRGIAARMLYGPTLSRAVKGWKENWASAPGRARPSRNACQETILRSSRVFFATTRTSMEKTQGLKSLRENQPIAKSDPQGRLNLAQDAVLGRDSRDEKSRRDD
jgi:hypothetical protein